MQMFHELISCKWINLQKPRYYDENYDEKLKITGAQTGTFQAKTGFFEKKHFDKHFMHGIQKQGAPQGKIFLFFLQDIVENCTSSENLTHKCTQTGQFFPILEYFLSIFKKYRGNLPSSPILVALQS